ncbi:hypothetical protein [Leifsonia aquatica]|uniref:hypothetical protein n=1 Tax=Leifsonia aquatica TaxID=144185 RepID=UPI0013B39705|nr:hypothetical protein [Leifsonia aquatica]
MTESCDKLQELSEGEHRTDQWEHREQVGEHRPSERPYPEETHVDHRDRHAQLPDREHHDQHEAGEEGDKRDARFLALGEGLHAVDDGEHASEREEDAGDV